MPNLLGLIAAICALVLMLRLPEPWNMRIPLYLVLLIWIILRPRVALYLMPIAVPWGSVDTITVRGLNLNSADILVIFLAIAWLMSYALRSVGLANRAIVNRIGPLDREASTAPWYLIAAILLLIAVMALSMMVAVDIRSSLKEIAKWLEFLVIVLLGTQYLRTRRQIWLIIVITCLAGISQAFFGYLQAFFNIGPEAFIRDASLRVYGTFGQPNPFAGYINLPLSIALAVTLLGSNRTTRIFAGIATVLLGAAVYLSQSRGAELATVAGLAFIIVVGMPRLRKPVGLLVFPALFVAALFLAGLIPAYMLNPVLKPLGLAGISFTNPSAADYSTAERIAHWIAGIRMFLAHPVLGVGIGNFPDVYASYYVTIFVNSLDHAHNYYINIAAETGAIGLTIYLFFLMAIFLAGGSAFQVISKRYWQAKTLITAPQPKVLPPLERRERIALLLHPERLIAYYRPKGIYRIVYFLRNDRALAVGLLAAQLTICVHNLFDDLYVHSLTNLMALLLVALLCLARATPGVTS